MKNQILTVLFSILFLSNFLFPQGWESRSELSQQEFNKLFDKLSAKGYVPYEIDAINDNGRILYSGVWRQESGVSWQARYGWSEADFQLIADSMTANGYFPARVSVYKDIDNSTKFASIWRKKTGTSFIFRYGLTVEEYARLIKLWTQTGYIPCSISAYEENKELKFAVTVLKDSDVKSVTRHNLTEAEYQKSYDELTPQGYIPVDIAAYSRNGVTNFAAVWIQQSGTWWQAHSNMTSTSFQEIAVDQANKGFSPYIVATYINNGYLNFAVAWQYDAPLSSIPLSDNDVIILDESDAVSKALSVAQYDVKDSWNILNIRPVMQNTLVWCWLACGEMIFRHFGIPSQNAYDYHCGIVALIAGPKSACYRDCSNCIIPSGSNYATISMLKNYSKLAANKNFYHSESKRVKFQHIKNNIDNNQPVLCGISYQRREYDRDSEHVVVVVGYSIKNGIPYLIVNDPYPYPFGQNPYLHNGAQILNDFQYEISYDLFKDGVFWNWTVSNITISY